MLGRHVYRVTPRRGGGWNITMEGGESPTEVWESRAAAVAVACKIAAENTPSRVLVENANGTLADDRQFGTAGEADLTA
jgi:hypothetical protein